MKNILYLVVPCYNEQEVLSQTAAILKDKLTSLINKQKISSYSKILFVNDGSTDNTWQIINNLHLSNNIYSAISLTKNVGHQNALFAGLMVSKNYADIVISIDADLQDDIDVIDEMIDKYMNGCDIVYGVRNNRQSDTFFKRFTAEFFYKTMNILGADSIFNHADYRLMSKRALNRLQEFKEANLFLRGIIPLIGYKSDIVEYSRRKRSAGKSKYPLTKMISFAADGITSFSIRPIRCITILGFIIFILSIIMLIYIVTQFFLGNTVSGWSSITVSVWAIGGLLLLSIGIIGEYIARIYLECKQRPRFFISEILNKDYRSDDK